MDDVVFDLIKEEEKRQRETLMMIPSENYTYPEVRRAVGSVLMHKYAEGYPGARYYQGTKIVDEIEILAQERAKKLFSFEAVNVQPYSGSPANGAVLFGLLERGDKICGLKLSAGGHLTHGHPKVTFSGKYFESIPYDVEEDGRINEEKLRELVKKERPKLIFVGTTAYPFMFDFEKFGQIADEVGAWLVADISHIAGLVAGGVHSSPVPFAHLVTLTTHKSLRGPRGAIIGITKKGMEKNKDLEKVINRAVFPGIQGGPHMETIAGIAIALEKAMTIEFKNYAKQVVVNAKVLSEKLKALGLKVFGTENHLMVVEVGLEKGKEVAVLLEEAGIVVNANSVPHDPAGPFRPSGIRLGTPAVTARGMKEKEMEKIGELIGRVILGNGEGVKREVEELCGRFALGEE